MHTLTRYIELKQSFVLGEKGYRFRIKRNKLKITSEIGDRKNKTKDKLRNNRYKLVTWSWNPFRKKPKVRQQNKNPAKKHAAKTLHLYLLPIFHHLTCKSTLHCKSGFGTINCHSKLNIYTLLKQQVNKQVYPK